MREARKVRLRGKERKGQDRGRVMSGRAVGRALRWGRGDLRRVWRTKWASACRIVATWYRYCPRLSIPVLITTAAFTGNYCSSTRDT